MTPFSPIVFNAPTFASVMDDAVQEEKVAKRLSKLGFVEVHSEQASPVALTAPQSDALDTDSNADASPAPPPRCQDVQITVELVPTTESRGRRASRFWIREKKGKRWVEDDYTQILHQLRRL